MDFDFSHEQKFIQGEIQKFLEANCGRAKVRKIFDSDQRFDRGLWQSMGELGWLGANIPECYGGSGMGQLELVLIAEEMGRALAPVPFFSSISMVAQLLLLAGTDAQKARFLPGLASGGIIGCVATQEQTRRRDSRQCDTLLSHGKLSGVKVPVLDGDIADIAIVSCMAEGQLTLAIADLSDAGVNKKSLQSLDASRSQGSLEFSQVPAEALPAAGGALLADLYNRAAVLLAFEQLGVAQCCLDDARNFSLQRYAFGRSVASFQAIKHQLADLYVAIELARANAYYGAWALANDADELPIAAAVARISATQALDQAAESNVHIHGGAGFTWEYDCHLLLRRAKLLSLQLGSARSWQDKLIDCLEAAA